MLFLSRGLNEVIIIGGHDGIPLVRVVIMEIRGGSVRVGIDAPREVTVLREELWLAKEEDAAEVEIASAYEEQGNPVG